MSKIAVEAFSASLEADLALLPPHLRVHVSVLAPGAMATPMTAALHDVGYEAAASPTPTPASSSSSPSSSSSSSFSSFSSSSSSSSPAASSSVVTAPVISGSLSSFSGIARSFPSSPYAAPLLLAAPHASAYVTRNEVAPDVCARAIERLICAHTPAANCNVNVSWEMWLASHIPRRLLAWVTALSFG
eukprot:TRINITY_DN4759_c2_g1_i1.p1 TRINITY_DN4759_c2_g1~~TRINITY_DN4759_c2_g1_i1.p1  ORF type:complete len:220 (+),score=55.45 TRINITY_DN4759_c2_g1_i1:99-662(+)